MGIVNLAGRAGKGLVREAGYVAGSETIKGFAHIVKGGAQSIRRTVANETRAATEYEVEGIKADFYERLGCLTATEYNQQARRWQIRSRWHYAGAFLLLAISAYFLITDPGWTGMNAFGLAALNFAHGLRASYRYWQMRTQIFFVEGAFKEWLSQGNWLV